MNSCISAIQARAKSWVTHKPNAYLLLVRFHSIIPVSILVLIFLNTEIPVLPYLAGIGGPSTDKYRVQKYWKVPRTRLEWNYRWASNFTSRVMASIEETKELKNPFGQCRSTVADNVWGWDRHDGSAASIFLIIIHMPFSQLYLQKGQITSVAWVHLRNTHRSSLNQTRSCCKC